jgi:excisionase family DNA binding protein
MNEAPQVEQLLTVRQFAVAAQISVAAARRKIRSGAIKAVRVGPRQTRITMSDYHEFLRRRTK